MNLPKVDENNLLSATDHTHLQLVHLLQTVFSVAFPLPCLAFGSNYKAWGAAGRPEKDPSGNCLILFFGITLSFKL